MRNNLVSCISLVLRIRRWRHCIFIAFGLRLKMARLFKIVGYGSEHVVGPSRSDAIAIGHAGRFAK